MNKWIALVATVGFLSCSKTETTQKNLESIDKKSAREVTLSTVTSGDKVYHLTKQTIWVNGEQITQRVDTVTTKLVEDTWESDTTKVKKLNEIPIYVTVL